MKQGDIKTVIDFTEYISERTRDFTGREWVFTAINGWLTKPGGSRFFLLTGEPGSGKTAIAGWLHQFAYSKVAPPDGLLRLTPGFLNAVHFCSARDSNWVDPRTFSRSIALQLAKIPEYAHALKDIGDKIININVQVSAGTAEEVTGLNVYLDVSGLNPQEAFNRAVMDPLQSIYDSGFNEPITILVDGLDESLTHKGDLTIVWLLSRLEKLPSQVRFILTSRSDPRVENEFLDADGLFLSAAKFDKLSQEDIGRYVDWRLGHDKELMEKEEELANDGVAKLTEMITHKAEGNFQYVTFLLNAMAMGKRSFDDLEGLPAGLDGLYYKSIERVVELGNKDWSQNYSLFMGVLSVAYESLTLAQLEAFTVQSETSVLECLRDLQQFIEEVRPEREQNDEEEHYRLYHQSIIDFLHLRRLTIEKNREKKRLRNTYYLPAEESHAKIVAYYRGKSLWKDDLTIKNDPIKEYAFKYLFSHSMDGQCWDDITKLLTDVEYLKKKQEPEQQWAFQQDFKALLKNKEIPTDKLGEILKEVLKAIMNQMEDSMEKLDWLDIFAYWIINFGSDGEPGRITKLNELARKFDEECGRISVNLANKRKKNSEYGWALRFAGLATWVYQRSNHYKECIDACRRTEDLCEYAAEDKVYYHLLKAGYIRTRARALARLASEQEKESARQKYEEDARMAYEDLKAEFSLDGQNTWILSVDEWKILEDHESETLLPTRSTVGIEKGGSFKAQVVSNTYDAISAMFVIQFLKDKGGEVKWIHSTKFKNEDFAPEETKFTILIGGPKAPGISEVADRFYEAEKDAFLRLYSSKEYVSTVIEVQEGNTFCYMVGGPSGDNTLEGAVHKLPEKLDKRIGEAQD